ncbi:MAG: hypothetical protein HC854_14180 [Flavobacterium sp.]|nr:hypothetical protein [Flavobacterium sp.]
MFSFKINYNDAESATALFNGNISETFWKTKSDNKLRKYNYTYDNLNRLLDASYTRVNETTAPNSYRETLSYDKNGNIATLNRFGLVDDASYAIQIDELIYTYDTNNKNLLKKVIDISKSPQGFDETLDKNSNGITDTVDDYTYDANGNMIKDDNKGITSITYNHLNLPTKILVGTNTIEYLYNATGQKVLKKVTKGTIIENTHYLAGGFQYKDAMLQFFPHAEGYVNVITSIDGARNYNYVFNYTDHLGNVRVSYGVDPNTGATKILEENHYYPFGLKHSGYNMTYSFYQQIQMVQ